MYENWVLPRPHEIKSKKRDRRIRVCDCSLERTLIISNPCTLVSRRVEKGTGHGGNGLLKPIGHRRTELLYVGQHLGRILGQFSARRYLGCVQLSLFPLGQPLTNSFVSSVNKSRTPSPLVSSFRPFYYQRLYPGGTNDRGEEI